jgi:hypothetical protein
MCKRWFLSRLWSVIEAGSKAAWILILIVASGSLYYAWRNYRIQANSDRPVVLVTGTNIWSTSDPPTQILDVYLYNNGKEDANKVRVIPTTVDANGHNPKVLSSLKH